MSDLFTRNIQNIRNINKQPFKTNDVNDLLEDKAGKHYIRRRKDYHCLTDNIKTINGLAPSLSSGTNPIFLPIISVKYNIANNRTEVYAVGNLTNFQLKFADSQTINGQYDAKTNTTKFIFPNGTKGFPADLVLKDKNGITALPIDVDMYKFAENTRNFLIPHVVTDDLTDQSPRPLITFTGDLTTLRTPISNEPYLFKVTDDTNQSLTTEQITVTYHEDKNITEYTFDWELVARWSTVNFTLSDSQGKNWFYHKSYINLA